MKKLFAFVLLSICALSSVFADAVYPNTNAVYTPSAISPAQNFAAPSSAYVVTLQNRGVLGVDISGTCTSLAATIQVSVDGTTWRTVNVYAIATGTITAAASITGVGGYRANVSGAKIARVNITALTASCNVSAVATEAGPSLVQ
jgi:hypothetical protein